MMTKTDTIEAITRLNPTANPTFLAGFSNQDLAHYLQRLSKPSSSQSVFSADDLPPLSIDEDPTNPIIDRAS